MECVIGGTPFGIFRMDTNKPSDSFDLLKRRDKGQWKSMCGLGCEKGDNSVHLKSSKTEVTFDFRFKTVLMVRNKDTQNSIRESGECEIIE